MTAMKVSRKIGRKNKSKPAIRACSACRKRKIKCSGMKPCTNCIKNRKICDLNHTDGLITIDGIDQLIRRQKKASNEFNKKNSVLSGPPPILCSSIWNTTEINSELVVQNKTTHNDMYSSQNGQFIASNTGNISYLTSTPNAFSEASGCKTSYETSVKYDGDNEPRSTHLVHILKFLQNLMIQNKETKQMICSIKQQLGYDWDSVSHLAKHSFFNKSEANVNAMITGENAMIEDEFNDFSNFYFQESNVCPDFNGYYE